MGNWDSYRDDLDALKIELEKLFEVRNDVMRRVRIAEEEEQQMMKPTTDEVVQLWLSKVQAVETEVDDLIRQISKEIEELHPGGFFSRNLLNMPSSYEFKDIGADKLQAVMNLIIEGDFVVADDEARVVTIPKDEGVAENLPEDVLYDEGTIVGMESIFTKVWRCLEEGGEGGGYVGIIGLYGMGGVGKTTLLKQIYRNLLDNYGQNNFAVVIWVSVSKELRLEKIQEKIGMKIGLFDKVWKNKKLEEKASDILKILEEKKFVLFMDELWERVDLTKVGVPFPNPENSSKIVFTTRSLEICRLMEADRQFKMNCLSGEEAWELFEMSVGDETLHSHPEQVVDIARDISKECSGLPLALVSIGRALAGNKTPQEWRDVLGVLTRRSQSKSSISGSDDQLKKDIYYNLKLSYDHLQNDTFKSCLLYCCLFPRNDKISKGHLIDCWIGEGFLDDRLGAESQGYHIIDVLLSACLLEEEEEDDNYVKMHNWFHDMSLWIATETEVENNFFVCTDAGLTEPPEIEKWVNMTRISMTKNGFTNLENAPMCSHLQTLFLNKNKIKKIDGDFFRFMRCLKVLNLSDNELLELPSEISNLVSLQHLDLSRTAIKSLPNQLGALKKLKCLNLEDTSQLYAIPPRLISTLSVLHVLRLQGCGFLDQSGEDSVVCKDAQLLIEELFCLKNLSMLSIGLRNSHALQKLLSSYRLQSCIQSLWLHSLQHPKSIVISISYMNHLKTLRISKCEYLEELEVDFVGEAEAQAISNFYFLDEVIIESCPNLQDLTWLILAPNLRRLEISQCSELEEIIKVWKLSECPELMRNLTPFLKLHFLKLSNLPNLRSIYWCDLLFPDLKEGTITECPKLQISLPPHRLNKDHSKEIITENVPSRPSSFNRKQVDWIKGPWSHEEDRALLELVWKHGPRNWPLISRSIPGRSGKSCRLRWCNYLSPQAENHRHSTLNRKWCKGYDGNLWDEQWPLKRSAVLLPSNPFGSDDVCGSTISGFSTGSGNKLIMHDLCRAMGNEIAQQESTNDPSKRTWLWHYKDIYDVPAKDKGTEMIETISLNMSSSNARDINLTPRAFAKMEKLRLSKFYIDKSHSNYGNKVHVSEGLVEYDFTELKYLHWYGYPLKSLQPKFHFENLVILKMPNSNNEELWSSRVQPLHNLKELDLCGSQHLISCPDLSTAPNLESLMLNGCTSLSEIPPSIQHLNKLEYLNFEDCKSLESIPDCTRLESLKGLHLSRCPKLKRLPEPPTNLEDISLEYCKSLVEIQSSFTCLHKVEYLQLSGYESITNFPDLSGLKSLINLRISSCPKLKMLPELPTTITDLTLEDIPIEEFPPSLEDLDRLSYLALIKCSMLKSLPSNIRKWKSLYRFDLKNCSKFGKLPDDIGALESLQHFSAVGTAIGEVPSSISCLKHLRYVYMKRCEGVDGVGLLLPDLPPNSLGLKNLSELYLIDCGITKLPDSLGDLTSLHKLDLKRNNFVSIPGSIINLSKLESLDISYCKRLRELPQLPVGTRIDAVNCTSLERVSYFEFPNEIFETIFLNWKAEFINCYDLDPEALNNVLKDTLVKIQGHAALFKKVDTTLWRTYKAYVRRSVLASIIYPESKIPEWFHYRSRGSFIDVKLPPLWLNCNFLCFTLCVVLAIPNPDRQCNHPDYEPHRFSWVTCDYNVKSKDGNRRVESNLFGHPYHWFDMPYCGLDYMKSNHVIIGFGYYFFREFCDNEFSFQFNVKNKDSWDDKERLKVEMCGVHFMSGLHLETTDESEEEDDESYLEESDEEDE